MERDFARIGKEELFGRLAQGHTAGVTVLTPNRRLSQALQADFERYQGGRGLASWETADILPFDAFVERLWDSALYSDLAAQVPELLTPVQEQALWEESIRGSKLGDGLFGAGAAAAQCRDAWRLAHSWRLFPKDGAQLTDDARAFAEWSSRYERATRERGQTDAARLPDQMAPLVPEPLLRKPVAAILYGFDIVTPQARSFLDALRAQRCEVLEAARADARSSVARIAFTEARDEIDAAARWARSRLESDPTARIGVVVPDLAHSRTQVHRRFAAVLQPSRGLAGEDRPPAFDISLGAQLADFPLVRDALALLSLAGPRATFEHVSRLVRSPFIASAEAEIGVRARLDAWLRERCGTEVTLESLLGLCKSASAPRAPILLDRLARLAQARKSDLFGTKGTPEWARAFSQALGSAGFPGERSLDSTEHQTLEKWHEALAQFATLERVVGKTGYVEACRRLAAIAGDTTFQPEGGDVPVQVVGVLESAGLEFDHLWVTGLTDESWPLAPRPNPFVPIALQRAARVPQADPATSLELDRRITAGWKAAAREVVFSHYQMKGESELLPSPLIADIPLASVVALRIGAFTTLRDAIHASGAVESLQDERGPPVAGAASAGGTSLFRDQAACPFRAFARHRLASEPLETPRPGLDARDRGTLVHCMLAAVWKALENRGRLLSTDDASLETLLGKCADEAIATMRRYRADVLEGRFAALERERLIRIGRDWLAIERRRDDFDVLALEQKDEVTFGGITVKVKLDRMDRLANGARAIIDYKTGACATAAWMGERPDEPQLPMYALGRGIDMAAVAFAQLKTGDMCFKGIARTPNLIPGVNPIDKDKSRAARQYRDWDALVAGWRGELESIGRAFAAGDGRVDPKAASTCENCDQHMVCRIAEIAPFRLPGEGDGDD